MVRWDRTIANMARNEGKKPHNVCRYGLELGTASFFTQSCPVLLRNTVLCIQNMASVYTALLISQHSLFLVAKEDISFLFSSRKAGWVQPYIKATNYSRSWQFYFRRKKANQPKEPPSNVRATSVVEGSLAKTNFLQSELGPRPLFLSCTKTCLLLLIQNSVELKFLDLCRFYLNF